MRLDERDVQREGSKEGNFPMAALPDEVVATIAKAQVVPDGPEQHDSLIRRLLGRLATLLAQASETDDAPSANADKPAECPTTTTTCHDGTVYGYPPAYGVPANVAVQLLYDTAKLLEKVLDAVSDEELSNDIKELKERIAQALGINAQEFVTPSDVLREMRLAVTVSLGTQPVLPAAEASERLKGAWNGLVQVVSQSEYALSVGKMFDAMFALRAAVEAAVKSLHALAADETLQENEATTEAGENAVGHAEAEQAGHPEADQSIQASEAGQARQDTSPVQVAATNGQSNEAIPASDSGDAADSTTLAAQDGGSAPTDSDHIVSILQAAIAPLLGQIEELGRRIDAVESAIKTRRRVSSFVASGRNLNHEDDLWQRWLKASASERKAIMREAQRLLAAPAPSDHD